MDSTGKDLHQLSIDEDLRYRARAVLAGGRPVVAIALVSACAVPFGIVGVVDSGLPTSTTVLLGALSVLPALVVEIWYLRRRLEASLVLAGLSRERL